MSNSSLIPSSSILFVSSIIFLLFATSHSASLIEVACTTKYFNDTKQFETKQCIKLLESDPKIASAKTYKDLSISIILSGAKNATKTRAYLDNLVKKTTIPHLRAGYGKCKVAYGDIIFGYRYAHGQLTDDYPDGTEDGDFTIGAPLEECTVAVSSAKITDPTLLSSNRAMWIYQDSGIAAIRGYV